MNNYCSIILSLLLSSLAFSVVLVNAIGEGIADGDIMQGLLQGFADIFNDVNTTDPNFDALMGRWHQIYKAAINFDVFRTQMYCPVSYYKPNLVMGPAGFSIEEAFHVITRTGPIETYLADVSRIGPGKYWVYPQQYFYPHQMYIIQLGPKINNSYQYIVATDQNRLALTVMAREPLEYFAKYDKLVLDFLKEERFGNPVFWNQPQAIYHGADCYYPSEKEVFARRVLQQYLKKQQGGPQQPLDSSGIGGGGNGINPLQTLQGVVGGFAGR